MYLNNIYFKICVVFKVNNILVVDLFVFLCLVIGEVLGLWIYCYKKGL